MNLHGFVITPSLENGSGTLATRGLPARRTVAGGECSEGGDLRRRIEGLLQEGVHHAGVGLAPGLLHDLSDEPAEGARSCRSGRSPPVRGLRPGSRRSRPRGRPRRRPGRGPSRSTMARGASPVSHIFANTSFAILPLIVPASMSLIRSARRSGRDLALGEGPSRHPCRLPSTSVITQLDAALRCRWPAATVSK